MISNVSRLEDRNHSLTTSRPANINEPDLVARAVAGDREAFGDLYERLMPAVYRYIYYRVGDQAEAEDLTETVFLRAWEALGRYQTTAAPFLAWLYRIAHNLVVDWRRGRRPAAALPEEHPDESPEADPETQVLAGERSSQLARLLRRLDPIPQQVLALRFIAGLSHAETARVLGRSESAVRVAQHRALNVLRALLRADEAEHAG